MEIVGKVERLLELKTGEGKNGPWKKLDFILETDDQYPKKVCISVWGDKVDQFAIKEGETLEVSINIESREYNERWYTDVKAWKINRTSSEAPVQQSGYDNIPDPEPPMEKSDDLPF